MSAALETRAEIARLAKLLGAEPERFGYLSEVPAADLRRVRRLATDVLFDADREVLGRAGAGSRLLPTGVVATIAERSFGPLLCARIAGLLEADRANEVASHLDPSFLADVAVEMDPRRASDLIGRVSIEHTQSAAAELSRRGEHVAMGRFVAHLPEAALSACLEVMDDAAVLRTAFVVEDKDRLDHVTSLLAPERLAGLIRAANEHGLWPETLDLLGHLGEERRRELADLAAAEGDEVLAGLVAAAQAEGLWAAVLPVSAAMSEDALRRFAALPALHRKDVLAAIVRTAAECGLWPDLLPLLPLLPRRAQRHVAACAASLEPEFLSLAVAAAGEHGLWPMLVGVAADMDESTQRLVALLVAEADDAVVDGLLAALPDLAGAVSANGRLEAGLRLLVHLEAADGSRLTAAVSRLNPAERERLAAQARALGVLDRLGRLGEALGRG
jgi:hypothetical protein